MSDGEEVPATEGELLELESQLGIELPAAYRSFLRASNGLEKEGVYLYGAKDLPRENEIFDVRRHSADHLNIGDNGGGEAYVLSLSGSSPVWIVGHGSMHPDDMRPIAESFADWISAGFPLPPEDDEPGWERLIDIYLEKQPAAGVKDVYLIRKVLGLDLSVSELLKSTADLPAALLIGVPYGRYWERVQELNQKCGDCLALRDPSTRGVGSPDAG